MNLGRALPAGFFADTELPEGEYLRLHLNENPYGPPPGAIEAVHAETGAFLHRYPGSECTELRAVLAAHFGVAPEMIAVGNGTDELVLLASLTFLREPGACVLTTAGTFPGYVLSAASVGAAAHTLPLHDAAVPVEALADELNRGSAALAFVCNPVNPTGTVLDRAGVHRLVDAAERGRAILVLDEAYLDYAGPAHEFALAALAEGRRLVVLRTFSKAWGLAAVRLGVAIGPADLVARVAATAQALPFNVNRAAQRAVLRALEHPEHMARVRSENARTRHLLHGYLDKLGFRCIPSVTNFVMARIPDEWQADAAGLVKRLAMDHRILVRDLAPLGSPGYVRISVGTSAEVERLTKALADLLGKPLPHGGI
ncbi:pyridoxal phosphate-dependent aminotransferase [Streptomyces sp. NPDC052396]|uniref:pyridoxal phosphate-dependent aminotransferase n=1 Tax=Streptomyces sp. NPDC052396 TaxID=3365689 RepID=UPI0037D09F00